jgi:hypothetical protein
MCHLETSKTALGTPILLLSECPGPFSGTKRVKREASHSIRLVQRLTLEDIYIPLQPNTPSLHSQENLYLFSRTSVRL